MDTPATTGAPDAVEYRGKVRARDRETSWEAASHQDNQKIANLQVLIYELLVEHGPMTDDEIRARIADRRIEQSRSGPPSRRHELELAGWVTAATTTTDPATLAELPQPRVLKRRSTAGVPSIVWRAVRDDEPAPEPRQAPAPRPAKRTAHSHEAGMAAAIRLAAWQHGDTDVARTMIDAYLHPDKTNTELDNDGAPIYV